jgi:SAM-dependent methyltransferase
MAFPVLRSVERVAARRRLGLSLDDPGVALSLRGSEYDLLLARLGYRRTHGARVLLQGVGTGAEVALWEPYEPAQIIGVDYEPTPHPDISMIRADLLAIPISDGACDVAASFNTFEHVQDLERGVSETVRILRPGGWFVASFGPLYRAYGGDHFSSLRGGLEHGYNHLLLDGDDYRDFVEHMTIEGEDFVEGKPRHGLAYIHKDLFSHASFDDYREAFSRAFDLVHLQAYTDPHCLEFRQRFPDAWTRLLDKGYKEADLLISTVTVIGRTRQQLQSS